MARLPYISLKDQLKVVNWVSANLANQSGTPKLVVIRKKRRDDSDKINVGHQLNFCNIPKF
nr:hypothetical protein [Mycoplasmopsis bovis]